jgi:hypothetical protein
MIARLLLSTEFVRGDTRTILIADGHRDDGKRSVVHADERFTAFVELGIGDSRLWSPRHRNPNQLIDVSSSEFRF